jgi:hypothetical protein
MYSILLFFSACAVLSGSYALYRNRMSHDATATTFVATIQNLEVKEYLEHNKSGALPLALMVGKLRLRFRARDEFLLEDRNT